MSTAEITDPAVYMAIGGALSHQLRRLEEEADGARGAAHALTLRANTWKERAEELEEQATAIRTAIRAVDNEQ